MLTEQTPRRHAEDILFEKLIQNADKEMDDLLHSESLLD